MFVSFLILQQSYKGRLLRGIFVGGAKISLSHGVRL
jgi:hypothetical protein